MMINDKEDEVVKECFKSFPSRYQIGLKTTKRGSSFIFEHGYLLYYKCHKINLNRDGSYVDSPNWLKNNRAIINPINKLILKDFNIGKE